MGAEVILSQHQVDLESKGEVWKPAVSEALWGPTKLFRVDPLITPPPQGFFFGALGVLNLKKMISPSSTM